MTEDAKRRVPADQVTAWSSACFRAAGLSADHAHEGARVLTRTNLRGIDTHGVSRVSGYVDKILSGEVNAGASPSHSEKNGALFFDGDGGLGQAVATEAVRLAVDQAKSRAVVNCFIRGSGHLAAIGMFVLEAAEQGMIAMLCQETPPLMALEGSSRPSIGNNPIAFAFPVQGQAPVVFDMATSTVARGNLLQAVAEGQTRIPGDWAIGPDGKPTEDPQAALKGAMLPVAGHKGVGLSMMVQVLAGSLTGSLTAASASKHGAMSSAGNVSAYLMVMNPDLLVGREAFDTHVRSWLDTYLDASGPGARYPGQRAAECEAERSTAGIPLSDSSVADLDKLSDRLKVDMRLSA